MTIDRIAVLMTSHNRRELTAACLESLAAQRGIAHDRVEVFLVDDGCTDGTPREVKSRFPNVHLLEGTGSLFWNQGMRLAFSEALKEGFDAYLLLNDDTILCADAVARAVAWESEWRAANGPAIIVGATRSPLSGKTSYGGLFRRTRGLSLRFELAEPHPTRALSCDTMNGNFVLIPAEIARSVGNLEARFRHQFGDIDYGLRAKEAGFGVIAMPGFAGDCLSNPMQGTWRDPRASSVLRWRHLFSPKGVPFCEWITFTRRHFGWRWLHYALSPYLKTIASAMLPRQLWRPARAGERRP